MLGLLGSVSLQAETLYRTDFDDFPTGNNSWAGFDEWLSNDNTSGVQAIDDGLFEGALGKTAALGFNQPGGTFTTVARAINYDPAVGGNPIIEFQSLFGIEDSTDFTNFRRDDFFFSFYNMAGSLLAAIRLSNTESDFGFWRRDGNLQSGGIESDTGVEFVRGELHNFNALIDLGNNTWTVSIDGIRLFHEVTFNGTNQSRNLGPVAVEWQLSSGTPPGYGDNWILIADLSVETVEEAVPNLKIEAIVRNPPGSITLSWDALPGFDYLVEYSTDLQNWLSDLPDASKSTPLAQKTFEFVDDTAKPEQRYYRVRQIPVGGGATTNVTHQMRDSTGEVTIAWSGHAGFSYQVEHSADHQNWSPTLPGSAFSNVPGDGPLKFTDPAASSLPSRYYRLVRTNP